VLQTNPSTSRSFGINWRVDDNYATTASKAQEPFSQGDLSKSYRDNLKTDSRLYRFLIGVEQSQRVDDILLRESCCFGTSSALQPILSTVL